MAGPKENFDPEKRKDKKAMWQYRNRLYRVKDKRRKFVQAYLGEANFCGAEAAKIAGYSPRTARQKAWSLLHEDKKVRRAIEQGLELMGVNEDRIQAEISKIAMAETKDQPKVADKLKGLEMMAKTMGMLGNERSGGPVMNAETVNVTISTEPLRAARDGRARLTPELEAPDVFDADFDETGASSGD